MCIRDRVYVTRTPIDKNGGSTWDYLRILAAETGLMVEDDENILMKQYDLVDLKRDNVPLAQYLGDRAKLATCLLYTSLTLSLTLLGRTITLPLTLKVNALTLFRA